MDVEGVYGDAAFALNTDVGEDRVGDAKKLERLIHQVRTEVPQQPAAGTSSLAPGLRLASWTPAVKVRFIADQPAQRSRLENVFHAKKVAIPATALIGGNDEVILSA